MSKPRGRMWICAALVPMLVAVACGSSTTSSSSAGASGPSVPTGPPLEIGVVAPLTGAAAPSGLDLQTSVQVVAAEINASGGIQGRPLHVTVLDSASDPNRGVLAAKQLLSASPPPDLMFPDTLSSISPAIFPLTSTAKIVSFSSCTAASCGDAKSFPYQFQLNVPAADQAKLVMSELLQLTNGSGTSVGLLNTVQAPGPARQADFMNALKAHPSYTVGGAQTFSQGATDLTVPMSKLKDAGVKYLYFSSNAGGDLDVAAKALDALHWTDVKIIGDLALLAGRLDKLTASADVQSRIYGLSTRLGARSGDTAPSTDLVTAITKVDPIPASGWTIIVNMHDALLWYRWAVNKTNSFDAAKLSAAMAGASQLSGSQLPQGLLGFSNPKWTSTDHTCTAADISTYAAIVQPSAVVAGTYKGVPLNYQG